MRWFFKYWLLKWKYDDLEKKFNDLVRKVDTEFWEGVSNE